MKQSLLSKLLRKNVSPMQLGGSAIANLIGLIIVGIALQFYLDLRPIFNDEESFVKSDYLVVTRKVTGMDALMGGSEISEAEVADIEAQPWVRRVGRFTASDYEVRAAVALGSSGAAMTTQLFFESIPAEFLDVNSAEWRFDERNPVIPVIVSKDYLSLYNFGFAAAQGMPKISEGMAGMIPLQFTISGNGLSQSFSGRIVGFSARVNTILVPEEFMHWSNSRFGSGSAAGASRLIVEVNAPGDIKIEQYIADHNFEVAGDKANSNKAGYLFTIAVSVVAAVGVLISLLSFFVLILSIMLLLQKNTKKLQDLLQLGYTPMQVSGYYIRLVLRVNDAVLILALVLIFVARLIYLPMLEPLGIEAASTALTIVAVIGLVALITIGNAVAIMRHVNKLWRLHE